MSLRAATLISAIHGAALSLNLLQQIVFVFVFGMTPEAGLLFLALTVPSMIALIFGESLQISLLPMLVRASSAAERLRCLRHFWRLAFGLGLASFAVSLAWGLFMGDRIGSAWQTYLLYAILTSSAFTGAMLAATILVWLQSERDIARPALVHLVPGALVIAMAIATHSVTWVATAYFAASVVQLLWLWLRASTLRATRSSHTVSLAKAPYAKPTALSHVAPLLIGGALPMVQMLDRLIHSLAGLERAAAAAYLWAFVVGFASTISRGPTLLFSLWLASITHHDRARAVALPFALYMVGNVAGFGILLCRGPLIGVAAAIFPHEHETITGLLMAGGPLLAALGPLTALPALYRMTVQLAGANLAAVAVLMQFAIQILLSFGAVGIGSASVAVSGHLVCIALIGLNLVLQPRQPLAERLG